MSRVLVLVRHSKAEMHAPTDFERELTSRGRADSQAGGRWLADRGIRPDHAVVSAAARARETWDGIARTAGWTLSPDVDRALYAAEAYGAIDLLRLVPEITGSLVVIGHNPTMAALATMLDDGTSTGAALEEFATSGFPTTSIAVLDVDVAWADLGPATARLTGFHVGRGDA